MYESAGGRGPVLARFSRPAGRSTTLAVLADPHVTRTAEGTWKVFHRAEARFRAAIASANRLDVDAVVSTGDLTKDGAPAEFARVDALLSELDAPFLAVPGNHDVPKAMDQHETPDCSRFVRSYPPGALPSVVRVGSIDLVCLNSASMPDGALTATHAGAISDGQLCWLEATLADLETPVVVCHHPMTQVADQVEALSPDPQYRLGNAEALADVLADHDVPLVLSGHVHWPAVGRVGPTRQVIAPAACSFPQAALLVHVEPRGTTVSLLPLTDRRGLEEAYRYACDGLGRGAAFAESTKNGYFRDFPLVDESRDQSALGLKHPPERPVHSPRSR